MKTKILYTTLVIVAAMGLVSCATKTESGALVGTAAGAAVGAGVGYAVGGGEGALIGGAAGAVAGGITGGLIGNYMDRQEQALKKRVRSATIERKGNELVVRFASGILFDTGKSDLRDSSTSTLTDFAQVLKEFPDTNLTVSGHTDSTGTKAINQPLSESRAASVSSFLIGKGVEKTRITSVGYADTRPIATNDTVEGRQENRRVEIKIEANEALKKKSK